MTVLPFTVPAALWWTLASTAALGTGLAFLFTGKEVELVCAGEECVRLGS